MLKIYNTQTRRKSEFVPVEPGKIKIYICGPTVYNRIHIGNARTFITFDIIRRYLIWSGFDVTFVQNVTDVDDKIIKRAKEENTTAAEIAKKYTDLFIQDMHAAGVMDPDVRPKATEEITPMIELVQSLIDNGHAYEKDGDVYFDVESFKGYGSLSGRDVTQSQSGHRELQSDGLGLEERKQSQVDFALWKAAKPGEPSWDSPWGKGRPGWHIECSAMSNKYLNLPFDIHGGGSDLIFPHHENERAQSMCGYKSDFANWWMHSGMLQITNSDTGQNEKMSKSLDNFILLHEALEQVDANVLRMLMLQTHYRSPLVFGQQRVDEASAGLKRIKTTIDNLSWALNNCIDATDSEIDTKALDEIVEKTHTDFVEAMDDDFNTSKALGHIFTLVSEINNIVGNKQITNSCKNSVQNAKDKLVSMMEIFGIDLSETGDVKASSKDDDNVSTEIFHIAKKYAEYDGEDADEAIEILLQARTQARQDKQFDIADGIRDSLASIGLSIEDTPQGPRIAKK